MAYDVGRNQTGENQYTKPLPQPEQRYGIAGTGKHTFVAAAEEDCPNRSSYIDKVLRRIRERNQGQA